MPQGREGEKESKGELKKRGKGRRRKRTEWEGGGGRERRREGAGLGLGMAWPWRMGVAHSAERARRGGCAERGQGGVPIQIGGGFLYNTYPNVSCMYDVLHARVKPSASLSDK